MADQGVVYAAFIADALEHERKRRDLLDARGLAVVTTMSGLIALVVAGTVLITGKEWVVTSRFSVVAIVVAVAAFLAAGVLGLLAHRLRPYVVPDAAAYRALLTARWEDSETTARSATAQITVRTLTSLRAGNNSKANHLQLALGCQLIAIAAIAASLLWQALHG